MKKTFLVALSLLFCSCLSGCNAAGPIGPQGEQGVPGEKGEKGDKGDKGEKGDDAPHAGETCSVTYHLEGGTMDSPTTIIVEWGDVLDLPTPTITGGEFAFWQLVDEKTSAVRQWFYCDAVFCDIDLYAKYTTNQYLITLDTDGGTYDGSTYHVTYGDIYSLPTPSKTGYLFDKWQCEESDIDTSKPFLFTSDVIFIAVWDEIFDEPYGEYSNIISFYSSSYNQEEKQKGTISYQDSNGDYYYSKSNGRGYEYQADESVKALLSGVVSKCENNVTGLKGSYVEITTNDLLTVCYWSMSEYSVSVGDHINKGDIIGTTGTCLYNALVATTDYRLHIEVSLGIRYIDPNICYNKTINEILASSNQ